MLTRSRVRNGLQGLALECLVNLARPRQPARSAWPLCESTHLTIYTGEGEALPTRQR